MSNDLLDDIRENNTPVIDDEVTLALRGITEKRAATISYMVDEARRKGFGDEFARAAIARYGADIGSAVRAQMKDPSDIAEFAAVFTGGLESRVYEMETVSVTESEFIVHFHYCPYVNKWLQQKRSAQEIATLCDICMEGDEAVATAFAGLSFALGDTIAKGGRVCEIHYRKDAIPAL